MQSRGGRHNRHGVNQTSTPSADLRMHMEQNMSAFRGSNGSVPLSAGAAGGGGLADAASALALEKNRHEDTKEVLAATVARLESITDQLHIRDDDLQNSYIDLHHLKRELEAEKRANDEMSNQLAERASLEEILSQKAQEVQSLKGRLNETVAELRKVKEEPAGRRYHKHDDAHYADEVARLRTNAKAREHEVARAQSEMARVQEENRVLRAALLDAEKSMKSAAAALGKASLTFGAEADRVTGTLGSIKQAMQSSSRRM